MFESVFSKTTLLTVGAEGVQAVSSRGTECISFLSLLLIILTCVNIELLFLNRLWWSCKLHSFSHIWCFEAC